MREEAGYGVEQQARGADTIACHDNDPRALLGDAAICRIVDGAAGTAAPVYGDFTHAARVMRRTPLDSAAGQYVTCALDIAPMGHPMSHGPQ